MLNCEGENSGLSKFEDWKLFQKPKDDYQCYGIPKTGVYSGYDINGNSYENPFIMGLYERDNQNKLLSVPEYAEKWLKNFVTTGRKEYDGF